MGSEAVRLTSVDIDNALENDHFQVIFQPIFHLEDGALLRVESFVRWTHPGLGVLPPGAFISFFESQGRMGELTRHVLLTSLDAYIAWRGKKGPGFSVNLSQYDLTDTTFTRWLSARLRSRDFPPELLTLECPALPADVPLKDAKRHFARLKRTGVRLAIEVRGRASEMLRTISPFPFDEVKTGGSVILRFARTMRGGPGLTAISELVDLAREHEATIIAVGVEDEASLQALAGLGFTAAQGNFLVPIGELDAISPQTVNHVRETLSLPRAQKKELSMLFEGMLPNRGDKKAKDNRQRGDDSSDAPSVADAGTQQPQRAEAAHRVPGGGAGNSALPDEARLTPEKIALLKKKAAQVAARRRAEKKAEEARASSEEMAARLEKEQQALREKAARQQAEENARRLQSRLSKAYENPKYPVGLIDPDALPVSAAEAVEELVEAPAEEDAVAVSPEPQDSTQQGEPEMQAAAPQEEQSAQEEPVALVEPEEVTAAKPEIETEVEDRPVEDTGASEPAIEAAGATALEEPVEEDTPDQDTRPEPEAEAVPELSPASEADESPSEAPEELASSADEAQNEYAVTVKPAAEEARLPEFRSSMTATLRLSGIADIVPEETLVAKAFETENHLSDRAEINTGSTDAIEADEEAAGTETEPQAGNLLLDGDVAALITPIAFGTEPVTAEPEPPVEEDLPAALPEDLRSEDEVLDEAFAGAAELDPTEEQQPDEDEAYGHIELDSTERLIAGRLKLKQPTRPRRNFLTRRYRIMPTHFWPRAWKRTWQRMTNPTRCIEIRLDDNE